MIDIVEIIMVGMVLTTKPSIQVVPSARPPTQTCGATCLAEAAENKSVVTVRRLRFLLLCSQTRNSAL